jgi:DASS family divalent anion:Na+ symporter
MSSPVLAASTGQVPELKQRLLKILKNLFPVAMAVAIWFAPVPEGLTPQSWHLFAIFITAIVSVLLGFYPLLTSTMLAAGTVVLTDTVSAAKAFSGFANTSVLLVVIAFLVAQAVVKSGLGRRISLFMVSLFGRSSLGLAYSIVVTDAAIAPAFPSNTARGGVLYPIVLSVARDPARTLKIPRAGAWADT